MHRLLLVGVIAWCCCGVMTAMVPARIVTPGPDALNTLTPAEKAAGWRLLFDGVSTSGWRGFGKASMPPGWAVESGALTRAGAGGDIVTLDQFGNFELTFEWKVATGGNSGVFYRATEDSTSVWRSAHEYQLLDNAGHTDGKKPETTAGSAYALYAPAQDVTRHPGEWNVTRIIAKGTHVEHWMNGEKLLEFDVGSADWNARVAQSKFKTYPRFGKATRGFVVFQDHGDQVAFRNIKIRTL
jgi:hypothetical protein